MIAHLRVIILVLALCGGLSCLGRELNSAAPPPAPWPGPTGAWVYVGGEEFQPKGEGWRVVHDAAQLVSPGNQGPAVTNDAGLSGSGPGDGSAEATIHVPAAGGYNLHVRFSQATGAAAGDHSGPFQVTILQGGKALLTHVFGADGLMPTAAQPGAVALRWQRPEVVAVPVPGADLTDGAAELDELTLDEPKPVRDVDLAAGPATLRVSKMGSPTCWAPVRLLDGLLLTQDETYEPDYRDFGPQLYSRFTLVSADMDSAYLQATVDHLRGPSYIRSFRMANDGAEMGYQILAKLYLKVGATSPWGNVSRAFDNDADSIITYAAITGYQRQAEQSSFRLDFATAPDEAAIIQQITREGLGHSIRVRLPWNASADHPPQADYWYAEQRLHWLQQLPVPTFGRRPTQFALSSALVQHNGAYSPACARTEAKIAAWLGFNTIESTPADEDVADGLLFGITGASIWHMGPAGIIAPDVATMRARVEAGAKKLASHGENLKRLLHTNLMDEASPPSLPDMMASREYSVAFSAWVREHQLPVFEDDAQTLLDAPDALIELTDNGAQFPHRYLYSQKFRAWTIVNFFRQASQQVREFYPSNAGSTQNFSDGAVWASTLYAQGNDYWLWFKERALDVALSEDWTNQGATPQLAGWNGALLRSATKYHGQPLHMYVITSGRAPAVVKLKSYAHIAQGARYLAFYAYSPEYGWHEGGWATQEVMYPALAELSREIGAAEAPLMAAKPRPASVAMIYSLPTDIWAMAEPRDNTQGTERMITWLALRHAQVQTDVLVDQDVIDGLLAPYQVAYLHGLQIERELVAPLAAWVNAGGTLVLSPGAGSRDQYNAPMTALDDALGLQRQAPVHPANLFAATAYLPRQLKPLEQIDLLDADGNVVSHIDALSTTQRATPPPETQILARFANGEPAAFTHSAGKGRVILQGYMPALAYLREAYEPYRHAVEAAATPHPLLPTQWDTALRDALAAPALRYGGPQPVSATSPLVAATLIEGAAGWVVPLANWSGKPIDSLTVTLRLGRPCQEIHSSRQGSLPITSHDDGSLTITLPLDTTDMLYGR